MVRRPNTGLASVTLLDPEAATWAAMLDGWAQSMRSRGLAKGTIETRVWVLRRFRDFTGEYPWRWTARDIEEFSSSLLSGVRPRALSTVRGYHVTIRVFCDYLVNPAYDWQERCLQLFDEVPGQICFPWNTVAHVADFEAQPSRRPFSYDELEKFFAVADAEAERSLRVRSKGAYPALRDAQLFKTVYAFGLRRREALMLDMNDLRPNPDMLEWGTYGKIHVRFGKATKGSVPRRRTVLALPEFAWAIEGLRVWVEEIRPRVARQGQEALWLSERRRRLNGRSADARFARLREIADLDPALTLHSLRHSYVTHLIELGYYERFVQEQVGHRHSSTTAIYVSVSDDWKNNVFQEALARVIAAQEGSK